MKKSFSSRVKDELTELTLKGTETCIAELAAMLIFGENTEKDNTILIKNDRAHTLARIQALLNYTLNDSPSIDIKSGRQSYSTRIDADSVENLGIFFTPDGFIELDEDIYTSDECKRSFLRGAFVMNGTVSDPEKDYSCELFTNNENMALLVSEMLKSFGVVTNTVKRKGYYVTYMRDKNSVSDFLNIIGAHNCMMELMMTQIEKDMRNLTNRQNNCRIANIDKTIKTSVKQCEAIRKLQKEPTWHSLDDEIKELAILRIENVDMSLEQLGAKMVPPMSKSAVSRKMNKLIALANKE